MVAFAGNSILARMALTDGRTGAAEFTAVRLVAGAVMLALVVALRGSVHRPDWRFEWRSAIALFAYAAGFSFAYRSLTTGTGALILFAAVQLTMLVTAWLEGDRLRGLRALGLVVALSGLVYLLLPGLEAPPLVGALLMLGAGVAWGWYSLLGRGVADPVAATTRNFLLAAAIGVLLWLAMVAASGTPESNLTQRGLLLATISGAVTSGLGYVIWYRALRDLAASQAATVQLTVPLIAAWGGVTLLGESLSLRLMVAAVLILGGVGLTLRRELP